MRRTRRVCGKPVPTTHSWYEAARAGKQRRDRDHRLPHLLHACCTQTTLHEAKGDRVVSARLSMVLYNCVVADTTASLARLKDLVCCHVA